MKKIIKNYSYLFMSKLFACNVFGGAACLKNFHLQSQIGNSLGTALCFDL